MRAFPGKGMENATRVFVNTAIDDLEDQLESLREIPAWGLAVVILVSFLSFCTGATVCTVFVAIPLSRACGEWRTRMRATRLLDDDAFQRNVEMPDDPPALSHAQPSPPQPSANGSSGPGRPIDPAAVFIVPPRQSASA